MLRRKFLLQIATKRGRGKKGEIREVSKETKRGIIPSPPITQGSFVNCVPKTVNFDKRTFNLAPTEALLVRWNCRSVYRPSKTEERQCKARYGVLKVVVSFEACDNALRLASDMINDDDDGKLKIDKIRSESVTKYVLVCGWWASRMITRANLMDEEDDVMIT